MTKNEITLSEEVESMTLNDRKQYEMQYETFIRRIVSGLNVKYRQAGQKDRWHVLAYNGILTVYKVC